jgi:hypothetical protein
MAPGESRREGRGNGPHLREPPTPRRRATLAHLQLNKLDAHRNVRDGILGVHARLHGVGRARLLRGARLVAIAPPRHEVRGLEAIPG